MTKLIIEHIDNYTSLPPYNGNRGPRINARIMKDPTLYLYHKAFRYSKGQAKRRSEEWNLDFYQWFAVWGKDIDNRGTKKGCMSMTRIDPEKPWELSNVEIITRTEVRRRAMKEFWSNKNG